MRIVFLGDSLTEGVDGASYLRVLRGQVADDPRLHSVTLINAGRGGDTVFNVARRVARDVVPVGVICPMRLPSNSVNQRLLLGANSNARWSAIGRWQRKLDDLARQLAT
jgi:hypothetical protein